MRDPLSERHFVTQFPSNMAFGVVGSTDSVYKWGRILGGQLRFGLSFLFANKWFGSVGLQFGVCTLSSVAGFGNANSTCPLPRGCKSTPIAPLLYQTILGRQVAASRWQTSRIIW